MKAERGNNVKARQEGKQEGRRHISGGKAREQKRQENSTEKNERGQKIKVRETGGRAGEARGGKDGRLSN